MHGRQAPSLSSLKIGTRAKILTLISAENFTQRQIMQKLIPNARKLWNREIFHPSSWVLSILSPWGLSGRHKKSVHCVRHPVFTEQQHQPGIVQPKRPFGMGDGVGVGLGGMVRTSEEWALSLSGWDVHDHPKWFWRQKSVLMLVPVGSLDWGQRCEWWSLQFVNMICLVWFNSIAWNFHLDPTTNLFTNMLPGRGTPISSI